MKIYRLYLSLLVISLVGVTGCGSEKKVSDENQKVSESEQQINSEGVDGENVAELGEEVEETSEKKDIPHVGQDNQTGVVFQDGKIYYRAYTDEFDGIVCYDPEENTKKGIPNTENAVSVSVRGDDVYYFSQEFQGPFDICKANVDTNSQEVIYNMKTCYLGQPVYTAGEYMYTNLRYKIESEPNKFGETEDVYYTGFSRMNLDGTDPVLIVDYPVEQAYFDEKFIYFRLNQGIEYSAVNAASYYKVTQDGADCREIIAPKSKSDSFGDKDDEYITNPLFNDDGYFLESVTDRLSVVGNYIYYITYEEGTYKIVRINKDGTKRTTICEGTKYIDMVVSGDWIYAVGVEGSEMNTYIERIKLDGTEKKRFKLIDAREDEYGEFALAISTGFDAHYSKLYVFGDWIYNRDFTIRTKIDDSKIERIDAQIE